MGNSGSLPRGKPAATQIPLIASFRFPPPPPPIQSRPSDRTWSRTLTVAEAHDACILVVTTVVGAPGPMLTIAESRFRAGAVDVIQQDGQRRVARAVTEVGRVDGKTHSADAG